MTSAIYTEAKQCFANTWEDGSELLKRNTNKQYYTENQGLRKRPISQILSKKTLLLKFHQFCSTKGINLSLYDHFPPTANSEKPIFLNRKPFKTRKIENISKDFLMKVFGESNSAETAKESFTLTKRFVSSKI